MNSEKHKEINVSESQVKPTDLKNNNIEMFGQENIPFMNMHRRNNISDVDMPNNNEFNNIGTIPPGVNTERPPKKFNINKYLFLIVIIIVIGLIGGGIYYYLSSTRIVAEKAVITKTVTINAGDKLSLKLDDYAKFIDIKATNCVLDLKNVKNDIPGKYSYIISCGVNNYKGSVLVKDTVAPNLETKIVFKKVNDDVDVNEFIVECKDNSKCKFELENFEELKENLKTEGMYDAFIKVSDDENNVKTVIEKVIVLEDNYDGILKCNYKNLKLNDYDGEYDVVENVLYKSNFGDKILMQVVFTLNNNEEYKTIKDSINENGEVEIEGITGKAYFLNKNNIVLETSYMVDDLSYLTNNDREYIKDFYTRSGYECAQY